MDRVIAGESKGKTPTPDPLDVLFDILIEEGGSVPTVLRPPRREGHEPRAGAAVVLDRLRRLGVRHRGRATPRESRTRGTSAPSRACWASTSASAGVLKLEDAVRKMTSLDRRQARHSRPRRYCVPGNFADVTIFDPATVIDKATYTAPFAYPEGIEYVIVNGQVVLDHGKHTDAMPGRALRRK